VQNFNDEPEHPADAPASIRLLIALDLRIETIIICSGFFSCRGD